jgi:hypothetical protein
VVQPRQVRDREFVELPGARMPADHGLTSLGLFMELVGSVFAGTMALVAVSPLFQGYGGSMTVFALGVAGALRSIFHRSAGTALLYGSRGGALRPTHAYIGVSAAQTVFTLVLLNHGHTLPVAVNLTAGLVLLAWPATLLVVLDRPRMRALAGAEVLPVAEDFGFEGAAALMLIFGLVGAVVAALTFYTGVMAPDALGAEGLLILGSIAMLLVRSILHAAAGARGTRGIDSDGATEAASRYFHFGVASSVIAGGALLILCMNTLGAGLNPGSLIRIAVAVYLLLAWPLILRRFYTERNFAALLDGAQGPNHRRAPDAGMTAVGWLLLGLGVFRLAFSLPPALVGAVHADAALRGLDLLGFQVAGLVGPLESTWWWSVGVGLTQVWAGLELVRMSDRHRAAATIYGLVALAVALHMRGPGLEMALPGSGLAAAALQHLGLALDLVVPAGALLLANRQLLPAARVRAQASASGE